MHAVRWSASLRQGELTHMRSMCVGVAETGGIDRVRLRESVNSREVSHSLTWHSSKSESALERFEPVAVAML